MAASSEMRGIVTGAKTRHKKQVPDEIIQQVWGSAFVSGSERLAPQHKETDRQHWTMTTKHRRSTGPHVRTRHYYRGSVDRTNFSCFAGGLKSDPVSPTQLMPDV